MRSILRVFLCFFCKRWYFAFTVGDHAKNISISTGELHGDVGLGICHYFTLPFLPGHPMLSKLRFPERSAASSAFTAFW